MPRPSDNWFRKHRIESMVPHVDRALSLVVSARRAGLRCGEVFNDVGAGLAAREPLESQVDSYEFQRDRAEQSIDLLYRIAMSYPSEQTRRRALEALAMLAEDLSLDGPNQPLPPPGVYVETLERVAPRPRPAPQPPEPSPSMPQPRPARQGPVINEPSPPSARSRAVSSAGGRPRSQQTQTPSKKERLMDVDTVSDRFANLEIDD